MQVWGVAMMRDEQDVAYDVITHLADEGFDAVIIADNRSTDGTANQLAQARHDVKDRLRVHLIEDHDPGYYQSRKMTGLADAAFASGATWIVPFDADELWVARSG